MPHPTHAVSVRHPDAAAMVALDPGVDYADDDPLVRTYPWAFAARTESREVVEEVRIERATKRPGERRNR